MFLFLLMEKDYMDCHYQLNFVLIYIRKILMVFFKQLLIDMPNLLISVQNNISYQVQF